MKFQPYEARLIPSDLRHDECILQVADSLDHLGKVANTILDGLQERLNEYKDRLQSIQNRAELAKAKISAIRGSSKATKVFSSYKYPASDTELAQELQSFLPAVPFQPSHLRIRSQHVAPDERLLKEKLQFFNVRPPAKSNLTASKPAWQNEEGLGRLPESTESIGSLLLFNTGDNPYTRYVQHDPLGEAKRTTARAEEAPAGPGLLGAAPASMSGTGQRGAPQEGFLYSPGMGQVPQMDAPAALPHLPGIADDLSYSEDLGPSIAPSWLPELPEVPADSFEDVPPSLPEVGSGGLPPLDGSAEPVVDCPPFLEPDEVPELQPEETVPHEGDASALESSTRSSNAETRAELSLPVTEDGSARASLLESIRQAGGKAGLKSARRPQQQRKQVVPPGGDLMSDLKSKLQLRRRGISGETDHTSKPSAPAEVTSPLDRVLEMIPPPKVESEEASTTDTEWNDSD
ncbi:WASH complex subunit washout [Rhipicephalus microplus]|uniref:WASH complex subunit washout n=1 Tax=Rhipicephalus microplus TaxID=6941 RepID=UPI003F6BF27B